jgi:hypothetical protein
MIITNRKREGYLIELETRFDSIALILRGRQATVADIEDSILSRKVTTEADLKIAAKVRSVINRDSLKLALDNITYIIKELERLT